MISFQNPDLPRTPIYRGCFLSPKLRGKSGFHCSMSIVFNFRVGFGDVQRIIVKIAQCTCQEKEKDISTMDDEEVVKRWKENIGSRDGGIWT